MFHLQLVCLSGFVYLLTPAETHRISRNIQAPLPHLGTSIALRLKQSVPVDDFPLRLCVRLALIPPLLNLPTFFSSLPNRHARSSGAGCYYPDPFGGCTAGAAVAVSTSPRVPSRLLAFVILEVSRLLHGLAYTPFVRFHPEVRLRMISRARLRGRPSPYKASLLHPRR